MICDWVYWLNFLLYAVNNIITFAACVYMLTPRISKIKATVLLSLVFVPSLVIKFAVPLNSVINIILALFNSLLSIMFLYSMCRESLAECALVNCCVIIASMLASFSWDLVDFATLDKSSTGMTLGYLTCIPILTVSCMILVCGKNVLSRRGYSLPGLKMTVLLAVCLIHCVIMEFVMGSVLISHNMNAYVVRVSFCFMLVLFTVLLIMIYKKSEERHQLEQYSELKKRQQEAEKHYELLLKKTEMMHRIRHDFYGQLTTARYIISQDREKGLQMINELNERLSSVIDEL